MLKLQSTDDNNIGSQCKFKDHNINMNTIVEGGLISILSYRYYITDN